MQYLKEEIHHHDQRNKYAFGKFCERIFQRYHILLTIANE